jgi:O-antigen ligase
MCQGSEKCLRISYKGAEVAPAVWGLSVWHSRFWQSCRPARSSVPDSMATRASKPLPGQFGREQQSPLFLFSASVFRIGLALVTFEQVRPGGIMLSDYCFLLSLILIPKSRLFKSTGSGVLLAGSLILSGALLSLRSASSLADAAGSLAKLFVLFGMIAPLALSHSKDIRKNLSFLAAGIFVNCVITLVQAWIYPGIVDVLSINPPQPDVGFIGRYQGLTEFPVTLGLSAALGVLIGIGLFSMESNMLVRWGLAVLVLVCSVAALLSGSRTFLASLLPGLMVFALLQKKRRRGVVYAAAVLIILWGAVTYVAPAVVTQYSDRLESVGFVDYGRLASAAQAILEISEKPILGWGVDHFDVGGVIVLPDTGEITGAHNTFLRYWYAAGLLGAVGFLTLFVRPAWRMLQILREKTSGQSTNAVPLILASYVFFFIVSNLGPYLYNRYLYVPLFVMAGLARHAPEPVKTRNIAREPIVGLPAGSIMKVAR